jgi:hypothetical protein
MLLLMHQQVRLIVPPALPPTIPVWSALSLIYLVLKYSKFQFSASTDRGTFDHFCDVAEEFISLMGWTDKYRDFVQLINNMLQLNRVLPVESWNHEV